jgi:hypothetical protein
MDDLASVPEARVFDALAKLLDLGTARKKDAAKDPSADAGASKEPAVDMRGGIMGDLTSLPTQRTSDSVEQNSERGTAKQKKLSKRPPTPKAAVNETDMEMDFEPEPDRKLDVLG